MTVLLVSCKKEIKKQDIYGDGTVMENILDEKGKLTWITVTDVNGNPIMQPEYKVRYLKEDGTQISKSEYLRLKESGVKVYKAAFVGCTYHCG